MNQIDGKSKDLNREILVFGRKIFDQIGKEQPSAFNKNFWISHILEWAMTRPELKLNIFRLVDVLPVLKDSKGIARHIDEYLEQCQAEIPWFARLGLHLKPELVRNRIMSLLINNGVRQMAELFIAGETPESSLKALRRIRKAGMAFTIDLLGEYSLSEEEASVYMERYLEALEVYGNHVPCWQESAPIMNGHPGETLPVCISVKLSALYSQCSPLNFDTSVQILSERLSQIVRKAKAQGALVYVDTEDTSNNPVIIETYKRVFADKEFLDFPYPGLALQAYARNAEGTLRELIDYAKRRGNPIAIRLVKGAYWDHENIIARQNDWPFPLFSDKESSDANFETLSAILVDNHKDCLPVLASHNIRSLSFACCYARQRGLKSTDFELQMLYGMAEPIARAFASQGYLVRLYVPLGRLVPGMGYLVRRLLENTSNESFLRHTFFHSTDIDELLTEPEIKNGF